VEDNSASSPLKIGILGAAAIAPPAIVLPAISHPEVELYAVAARDIGRAEIFAKKHGFKKWYGGEGGYQGKPDKMLTAESFVFTAARQNFSMTLQ
jgi:hypothetical protein